MRGHISFRVMLHILPIIMASFSVKVVTAFSTSSTITNMIPQQSHCMPDPYISSYRAKTQRCMLISDPTIISDISSSWSSSLMYQSSPLILAETEQWVQPLSTILGPILNLMSFSMVCFCRNRFVYEILRNHNLTLLFSNDFF